MGFHPEGVGKGHTAAGNRAAKLAHVRTGTVHQLLVYAGDECVGWCQYGSPAELPNIKNPGAYAQGLVAAPDWRIGCLFTGKGHRGRGVARAAVSAALDAIHAAGGGVVEAYPEQVEGRAPQRGAYFHTGPETLFEEFGFTRDRQIAKWRWVMRLRLDV
jgi:GNAT superfamily N-acetyltransferase